MTRENTNRDASIGSLLARPHLPESTSNAMPADPVVPMRIKTTLDQVVAYTDNPRQTKNPLFDEIKESIRNRGLDHAPNVTRKTPSDPYMIKDGGNTRLQALRELWEETGDERFYHLDLMFHPWKNQLDMLIGHAVENEMRGNMIFIERAFHAKKIKQEIESAEGITLSVRELARRITTEGWSLNQASLTQMMYAEETLFPVIPEAFWSGIGIDRVKKIRKLLDSCRTYWDAVSNNEGSFDDVWKPVFAKLDGEGFDVTAAEYQLCGAMAQRMDGPVLSVTAQVQGIIEGVKNMELVRPNRFNPAADEQKTSQPTKTTKDKTNPSTQQPQPTVNTQDNQGAITKTQPVSDLGEESDAGAGITTPADFTFDDNLITPQFGERKYSLTELPGGTPILYSGYGTHTTRYLQERALEVATSYARRFGLQQNILSTLGEPEKHIGFWVSSDGFESMPEQQRIHWVLLSTYSLIRHDNKATILLENMARALGGEIDIVQTVNTLMAVTHARTLLLGECARGADDFIKAVWEEATELEAIAATLMTRTFEESQLIDEVADPSFIENDPMTGGQ